MNSILEQTATISSILLLLYYLIRFYFVGLFLKQKHLPTHQLFNGLLSVFSWLVYTLAFREYSQSISNFFIVGAIQLPPFTLIFVLADALSTVLMLFILRARLGKEFFSQKYAFQVFEIFRLAFLLSIFSFIVTELVILETEEVSFQSYFCFQKQLEVDLIQHYISYGTLPESITEFTQISTNPFNNSPLVLSTQGEVSLFINDQEGNELITPHDLIGFELFKNDPSIFYQKYETYNQSLCNQGLNLQN